MSIKTTDQAAKHGYIENSSHSSISSSSSSSSCVGGSGSSNKVGGFSGAVATPTNWNTSQQYYVPQKQNPINDYENATPSYANPSYPQADFSDHYKDVPRSPTTAELSNASSYISYLVEQLNQTKDKLEKAEEKIKILESKDIKQYKEYLISSIDKFLAERTDAETITGKDILDRAT